MILTDREIRIYIDRELITVDPPPSEIAYASTSLDLTLDPVISTVLVDVFIVDVFNDILR